MMHKLLIVFVFLFSQQAWSYGISTAINLGRPLVFVDFDSQTRESLGALASVGTDINLFIPDYPFSAGIYYEAFVKSNYGILPITNSGVQFSYYPLSKPRQSQNLANQVRMSNLGLTFYGTVGTGLSFMNIRDPEGIHVFGAAAFNLRVSTTLEYPLTNQQAVGLSLLYQTTFGGTGAREPFPPQGFTGFSLVSRFVITLN